MRIYRNLAVWRRSRAALVRIYQLTDSFPRSEQFGLSAQLRRAAVSVAANIVEGSKRLSDRDYAHFLNISEGSAAEVGFLLDVGGDLWSASRSGCAALMKEYAEIERMLYALRRRIAG